ncbi:VOC family protein [Winogradskya consettensis]|uniref:Glyoxalase n=1 Tax=Winogradskya consettensis TaxID=113560 RepID=A0A919T0A0_9ACTN|nr:VOC family protein [Actinoplanes consettensis]GIM83026.1 glyoxalase [Actinoplanes consettensis]
MPTFPGLTHVAVTISDPAVSVPWYTRLIGADPVLDEDTGPFRHIVFVIGEDNLLGLHVFPSGLRDDGDFHPYRRGLDHVAFGCSSRSELEKWQRRLDELGIAHGGIVEAPYGSGLSFRDPDGIALEFFAAVS